MKTLLFLLSALILPCAAALAQPTKSVNNFTLQGTLTGKKPNVIWLRYADYQGNNIQLSAPVKNGRFVFKGFLTSPVQAEFSEHYRPKSPHNGYFTDMFLSPGKMTVTLSADSLFIFKLTGSVMQDDWMVLEKQEEPLMQSKTLSWNEINEKKRKIEYRFIQTHPNSFLSPFLIDFYWGMQKLSLDSAEMFYNSFTPVVKNSVAGVSLHNQFVYRRSSTAGSMAPLFAEKDMNGKIVDLKAFRNKNVVLLEFWASFGSGPNGHNEYAKNLYQKYHPKGLEMIGISLDPVKSQWKDAIKQNGTFNWHHLLNNQNIEYLYNVNGMPPQVFVLIDKNGKIAGRYEESISYKKGNTTDLDKKLAEIMGR